MSNNINNLHGIQGAIATLSSNVAGAKGLGAKNQRTLFTVSYGDRGNTSYVEARVRTEISRRGALQSTGNSGDIALSEGNGMFVFRKGISGNNADNAVRYKSTNSLRIDKDGYLSDRPDGSGYKLLGYKYDDSGNLPQVTSLLSSLTPINLREVISKPQGTTTIAFQRLTLDAEATKLKGAGEVIRVNSRGANANLTPKKIIMPEVNTTSGIHQGDEFTLTATPPGQAKTFVYGGIAISNVKGEIYGAGSQFTIAPAGTPRAPGRLIDGDILGIKLGNNAEVQLVARNGNIAQDENYFNSYETLAKAINKIPGLDAQFTTDRRILIAASDSRSSSESITFTNHSGGSIVEDLGLANVAEIPAAERAIKTRFASLEVLRQAIKSDQVNTKLDAEISGKNLDIHALLASSGFNITGKSAAAGTFGFTRAGANYSVADGGAARGAATVLINAPAHGLQPGDFVNLTGIGQGPDALDGRYMVGQVDADNFAIAIKAAPTVGNAFPAGQMMQPNRGTWQKIPGQSFPVQNANITAAAAAANLIRITNNNHNLANNDIVYISGLGSRNFGAISSINVPDGYYLVAVNDANNFSITPAAANGAIIPNIPAAGQFSYQKVSNSPGGAAAYNNGQAFTPDIIRTIAPAGGGGNGTVRVMIPHNNYNVGDNIRFVGLDDAAPVTVGNVVLKNSKDYLITRVGRDAGGAQYVEFTPQAGDMNAAGAVVVNATASYNNSNDANGNPRTDLGEDFRIDDYSRTLQYLGLDTQESDFTATYNPDDEELSLSNPDVDNPHRKNNRIFDTSMTVYDSLGGAHDLTFNFARVDDNEWVVEVTGVPDRNGDFDYITTRHRDGVIVSGTLTFDNDGNFAGSTVPTMNISWTTDGSSPSVINIDWNDIAKNAGIKQYAGQRSVAESVKPDGHATGSVIGFNINNEGDVYVTLNNNQAPVLAYKAVIATFDNIDGLEQVEDGMFIPTANSGEPKLRFAGENGAPQVISKHLEASNIDSTAALLELNDFANAYRANLATTTLDDQLTKEAIAKVGSV